MNSLQGLLYGLSIAATPANLLAAFAGAFAGTAIGVLPGLGPVAGVALILPLTFSLDPDRGPDHDGRHLLRIDVWRLDHGDPAQYSRRVRLRRHRHRRLSARQEGPRRSDADHRRGRLLRRRHARGHRRHDVLLVSRQGRDPVRACGIFRADRGRADRDVADFRRHAGLRAAADDARADARNHRPGSGHGRDALHLWPAGPRRRRVAGACRGRALRLCRADAAGRRQGPCREPAGIREDARAAADAHRMEARRAILAARHVAGLPVRPGARTGSDAGLVRLLPAGKGDLEIRRTRSAAARSKASRGRKPPTIPPPPLRWCRCWRSAFPSRRSRR